MVQPVKGLGTEGNAVTFLDREILEQANVVVLEPRSVDQIAHARGHNSTVGRAREDWRAVRVGNIKPEAGVGAVGGELPGNVWVAIDLPVLADATDTAETAGGRKGVTRSDAVRHASLHLRYGAESPAAQQFAAQPCLILDTRQFVDGIDHRYMSPVVIGRPPQVARVEGVRDD